MKKVVVREDFDQSPNDPPYRPLFAEDSEIVKIYYELTEAEVFEAILAWLEEQHDVNVHGAEVTFTTQETGPLGIPYQKTRSTLLQQHKTIVKTEV